MEKISECAEHTEALSEILQDAKRNGKLIVTSWLDQHDQNELKCIWYQHNLPQFALEWYHIPNHIRKMVFNYYDESYIHVKTKEWTTDWTHCGVGVFLGCPVSCILFLAVFSFALTFLTNTAIWGTAWRTHPSNHQSKLMVMTLLNFNCKKPRRLSETGQRR